MTACTSKSVPTSLILADEPTAALDGPLGRQVMELFARIAHERQAGVIVVTHDHRTRDVFDQILDVEDGLIQYAPVLRRLRAHDHNRWFSSKQR